MYALEGIRVLDVGQYLAGPFAPMVLADLGADVIKVEPLEGDAMRNRLSFLGCQRGKRGLAVDLKNPDGLAVFMDLARTADVIHHNMRPGVAEKLGIDYAAVKAVRPDIIYCHSPAYGIRGPRATWPGFDQMYQSSTGCEYEQGAAHSGGRPIWYRFGMCDTGNSGLVVCAITAALLHRQRTGEGTFCHTSLLNAGALFNSADFLTPSGPQPRPLQNLEQTGTGPDNRLYPCRDGGWVQVCAWSEAEWAALSAWAGIPGAARDAAAEATIATAIAGLTEAEAFAALDGAGVPVEPCRDTKDGVEGVLFDEELSRLGIVSEYEHPLLGRTRQWGHSVFFSETPGHIQGPAPLVGQHTRALLTELGYDEARIAALHAANVVYSPDESYTARYYV